MVHILLLEHNTFAGGISTTVAGLFSFAALDKPVDPTKSAQAMLGDYFKATNVLLENMARNLFGAGDQNKLPGLVQTGNWVAPVARVFDGGKFLIEEVGKFMGKTLEQGKTHLYQAIGMSVISAQGWVLVNDPGVKNEGACTKNGNASVWRSVSFETLSFP